MHTIEFSEGVLWATAAGALLMLVAITLISLAIKMKDHEDRIAAIEDEEDDDGEGWKKG